MSPRSRHAGSTRSSGASGRSRSLCVVALALLSACQGAASPGTSRGSAPPERDLPPGAQGQAAAATEAAQTELPKKRDRDPEAEKRKMAESRGRSTQAYKMLRAGRYPEAVANSRAALKIHEQNVEAMLVLGEIYFSEGKYELVHAVTSSALAVDEKIRTPQETSRAYNLKGFAYVAMDQQTQATQAFRKAAEADDNNAAAWNNLGTRYLDSGDVDTALACFTYALTLQPRFAKAYVNHGAALRAKGQWVEAERALNQALKLRPNYAEAFFNLGVLYLDAPEFPGLDLPQRLGRAISYLERYKQAQPASRQPALRSSGTKLDAPAVSHARADDYIRAAHKGLEREQRRVDREKNRQGGPVRGESSAAAPPSTQGANPAGGARQLDAKPEKPAAQPAAPETNPSTSPPAQAPTQPTPRPTEPQPTAPRAQPTTPRAQPTTPQSRPFSGRVRSRRR